MILMGVHRLPRIRNYWSKDCFLGISVSQGCMSLSRFWALWSNLHVVDNQCIEPSGGVSRKIKPVLDTLTTVEPPKRGHFGNGPFVLSSEVVPISEVHHILMFFLQSVDHY